MFKRPRKVCDRYIFNIYVRYEIFRWEGGANVRPLYLLAGPGGRGLSSAALLPGRASVLALDGTGHSGHPVNELGAEQDVGVVEHAVLERDHDELGALEVGLEHVANVLGVTEIQGRVHLV